MARTEVPELCDTAMTADLLQVPASTLAYWRGRGDGPRWYQIGRRVMYDRADIATFIASRRAGAAS
jgi:hypothetical protein